LRCRLPGLKPRVFVHERDRPQGPLREVGLVLDTIAIDVAQGKAFAVWRGSTPCQSEAFEEFTHLYLPQDELGDTRREGEYLGAFIARLRALWWEEHALEAEMPKAVEETPAQPEDLGTEEAFAAQRVPSVDETLEVQRQQALERGWPEALVDALYPP